MSAAKGLLCGSVPISRKKKRCSHCERRTRAKAKDRVWRWRCRALPVALVVRCRCRSSNRAPRLAPDISEPVHWKWKKKKEHNEELMRNCEVATKDMVPTPATQGGHVPDIPLPDGTLISNDDNSFISNTESEGGFGGANADDNGSEGAIPNEGAHGPNFAVDGEGRCRSTQ